jgi:hypothetical protein
VIFEYDNSHLYWLLIHYIRRISLEDVATYGAFYDGNLNETTAFIQLSSHIYIFLSISVQFSQVLMRNRRANNPNSVVYADDADQSNEKDRGCAPSATQWGLKAPLYVCVLILILAFAGGFVLYKDLLDDAVVERSKFLIGYRAFVKDFIHDMTEFDTGHD